MQSFAKAEKKEENKFKKYKQKINYKKLKINKYIDNSTVCYKVVYYS